MGVREGKIEKYLVDEIEKIGGTAYKFTSPGRVGVPDRIVCYKGLVVFVEVKSPSREAELSSPQRRELIRLHENKHLNACCHNKIDVDLLLKIITNEHLIAAGNFLHKRFFSTLQDVWIFKKIDDSVSEPIVSITQHLCGRNNRKLDQ